LSFSASASAEIKNNLDGLKMARRETLFYLLDCRVITVKFILSYNLLLITTNFLKTFWSQELPTWMPKGAEVIAEGI
jgi:hypothetical protein